jgi:glyoxylase-like metal-dependent hydrolase (beta-lactamase superfamily II)
MLVEQLAPGLWRWLAPHPDWEPNPEPESPADWPREVGCVYYEAPAAVVLIDPLVPPERAAFLEALDRDVERLGRSVAILLTVSWHERSAGELTTRYDASRETPAGVVPMPVESAQETLYWLPEPATLVAGDVLIGADDGGVRVCPDSWLPDGTSAAEVRAALRTLLDLPVERILVSHGEPVLADAPAALLAALDA